ncbi:MAG: hypothetical protein QXU98_03745 [Candidatus Parvarchaeota archaeon]
MSKGVIIIASFIIVLAMLLPTASYGQTKEYSVSITESGLPVGTSWYISVNGAKLPSTNNSTIVFLAANGSYHIMVPRTDGLTPVPGNFPVTVAGHNLSFAVTFGPPLFSVTFNESGLPSGTMWYVNITYNATSSFAITITNPPHGSGSYQQLFTFNKTNAQNILSVLNPTDSNFLIMASNGTPYYSWIQSFNSSSLSVWSKIQYNTSLVYFEVFPVSDDLLSATGYLGEVNTPYDNGLKVFPDYMSATDFWNNPDIVLHDNSTNMIATDHGTYVEMYFTGNWGGFSFVNPVYYGTIYANTYSYYTNGSNQWFGYGLTTNTPASRTMYNVPSTMAGDPTYNAFDGGTYDTSFSIVSGSHAWNNGILQSMSWKNNSGEYLIYTDSGSNVYIVNDTGSTNPVLSAYEIGMIGGWNDAQGSYLNVSYAFMTDMPNYDTMPAYSIGTQSSTNLFQAVESYGSTTNTITIPEFNGTYSYSVPSVEGINCSTPNGTLTVNGSNVSIPLRFIALIQFTFLETGLPLGSHWGVEIQGQYYNSSSALITIYLKNGTYSYLVNLPPGYSATPKAGKLYWNNTFIVVNASSPIGYEIGISVLVALIALALVIRFVWKKKNVVNWR